MEEKIMELVRIICTMESTNCRSLNKRHEARKIMDFFGIPMDATIHEIPLDWNNEVEIMFTIPEDKIHKVDYYFGLYAGIYNEKLTIELMKCGEWNKRHDYFDFYVRDKIIPTDYFKA